jgi:translation elongation factor EF-G
MPDRFNLSAAKLAGRELYTVQRRAGGCGVHATHESYGEVALTVEPSAGGAHLAIAWLVECVPAAEAPAWSSGIPAEFRPAITAAIRDAAGELRDEGTSICNIMVTILGGRFHAVNSSVSAYRIAARRAFRAALESAGLTTLAPGSS